ncbi:MAG: hypothetical protein AAFU64_03405 [Bacteroidota bacterium]
MSLIYLLDTNLKEKMLISIPFSGYNEDYTYELSGLLRLEDKRMVIELQTKDLMRSLTGAKAKIKEMPIPLLDIANIELKKNIFQTSIRLRMHRIKTLEDFPGGSKQGEIKLQIKKRYRDEALNLIAQAKLRISEIQLDMTENEGPE